MTDYALKWIYFIEIIGIANLLKKMRTNDKYNFHFFENKWYLIHSN